jgi:murein DD-endopeptidase MepM/ murein hydrolase activator NlpD
MVGLRSNSLATGKNWVAQFEGKTIESIPSVSDPHSVEFWFAIPYGHAPGKVSLTVSSGQSSLEVPFEVTSGDYLQEEIQVSGKHVHPSSSDLKRIQKESKQLGKVYRNSVARKLWSGTFVMPVENGVFTSPFGTQRVFNGSRQSFHQGVDLKAPTGTSILAPEGGRVVLAKDLFYTGNTVILDHGLGLFTVYAHLSELKVSVGQNVKVGTLLGLSGATGRASGPHLHWGALWRRVKFNPVDLTQVLR